MNVKWNRHMILLCVSILLAISIVMIYSSSFIVSEMDPKFNNGYMFLYKHLLWVLFSIISLIIFSNIDYRRYMKISIPLYILGIVMLMGVLIPGVGSQINGARRWFRFGHLSFQPSEFVKIAIVIFISACVTKYPLVINNFKKGFLPFIGFIIIASLLIFLEPDIGTACFIAFVSFAILFVSGMRLRYFLPFIFLGIPLLLGVIYYKYPYVFSRITSFLNPEFDPLGKGHQLRQSLIALGSGGVFGVGLGFSKAKLFFLPEEYTDFIFAIIGEELGFIGTLFVLFVFVTLLWYIRKVALNAVDAFGFLLTTGILFIIAFQTLINIAVVTASMPTKGIPLPFVSFGGSSLIFTMIEIGIVLNVARTSQRQDVGDVLNSEDIR